MSFSAARIMVLGAGASMQGVLHALKTQGAEVYAYFTKESGNYSPGLEVESFAATVHPNLCSLLKDREIDFVIPMSIDWHTTDWVAEFLEMGIPILSPTGQGMQLERSRDFARELCVEYDIPFPKAFVAQSRLQAEHILNQHPGGYVIKNPLCSPQSPVHTILCETEEDTRSWLHQINYEEGIFLQEFMGQAEAGHIAFVSGGEIYSLISNQEYKRAHDGNMGVITGAPLGGLVEKDPGDKYGLARQLLQPLLPWFREVGFHGPVQVTAMQRDGLWYVLEYNVRIGVTCGPIIMRLLKDPVRVLRDVVNNRKTQIEFREELNFGCSLTLAGYGYPYSTVQCPSFPVRVHGEFDCDVWWNDVSLNQNGDLYTSGQRIADLVAVEATLEKAIAKVYANVSKIRCTNSYYRTDVGRSLWPPGTVGKR